MVKQIKKQQKRVREIRKKLQNTRKEYLWILIAILVLGHVAWAAWFAFSEFYLVPRAVITTNQDEQNDKEVALKNPFAPSYSFYDNWGNLTGQLNVSQTGDVFEAGLVKGVAGDYDIIIKKVDTEGSVRVHTVRKVKTKDFHALSWRDISGFNGENYIFLDYEKGIPILDYYSQDFELVKKLELPNYYSIDTLNVKKDFVYFVAKPKYYSDLNRENKASKFERIVGSVSSKGYEIQEIYKDQTNLESDQYVTDIRLDGPYFDSNLVYEKIFHLGNNYNYSKTAINIESGESDIFESDVILGIL